MKAKRKILESKLTDCIDILENKKPSELIKKRLIFKVKETIKRIEG